MNNSILTLLSNMKPQHTITASKNGNTTMKTMSSEGLCGKESLIGEWTVMFASLPTDKLYFQVMDEILPHSEEYYLECNTESIELPIMQPSIGK